MIQLRQAKSREEVSNNLALETEKEQDVVEKAVEELKRHLYPKRARTHDDTGDAHEVLVEVGNWDLRDHHQETTRVQNRRNVELGSLRNQQKPHTCKDGFLHHTRLGLVGWISYWYCGDSDLSVDMFVVLIRLLICSKTRLTRSRITEMSKFDIVLD
jgi:hypothetical protein